MDLGSGSGVLANEARARWPAAALVTVDLDSRTAGPHRLDKLSTFEFPERTRHVHADVSSDHWHKTVQVTPSTLDLAISNPPYTHVPWRPEFQTIMTRAGLDDVLAVGGGTPLDVIFLAQALHMLRRGGKLAFVVPDLTVSGSRFSLLRKLLIDTHGLNRVVQLPRRAFKGTDAQAFVIFLVKGRKSQSVRLDCVNETGDWSTPMSVAAELGAYRLDYEYHAAAALPADLQPLSELEATVSRGVAFSRQVAVSGGSIFHTCDFPSLAGAGLYLPEVDVPPSLSSRFACKGDILLARVDRRLEEKVAVVVKGAAQISDCVIRIRCAENVRERVLAGLVSDTGKSQLRRLSRGTGARHITLGSVLNVKV
jgi:type I restriction enzyme M protein